MARPTNKLTCDRKIAYGSKQAARKALRHHKGSAAVMHAYKCGCGRWHIGHRDERGGY